MLGVLLLREGLPAERDRRARLRGLRALGHSVRTLREEAKGTISWRLKFRDGREKNFVSPIRTTPWGSIKGPAEYEAPRAEDLASQELAHEPTSLKIEGGLPALHSGRLRRGTA